MSTKHNFSQKVFLLTLAASIPSYVCCLIFLWLIDYSVYAKVLLTTLLSLTVFGFAWLIKQQLQFQFQTLSNLVEAIRGGDFTLRGTKRSENDPLAELTGQINLLSSGLSEQRIASEEAYRLLEKSIAHINVAIFAFDANNKVKLANPAAGHLFACDHHKLIGQQAEVLLLGDFLSGKPSQLLEHAFPGGTGRWQIRLDSYRDKGIQGKLLFITDLKTVLREEELKAWKNLIKVISHEVNNSLYPISSISQTLSKLTNMEPLADDWQSDITQGLSVINERANNLTDFIKRYAKVAKLPEPNKQVFSMAQLLAHIAIIQSNKTDIIVDKNSPLAMALFADRAMIEQVLINLLKNALEAGAPVVFSWGVDDKQQWLKIIDHGTGIKNMANLFVPFYSTKPTGSGIGLVLCQQIIDKHKGSLTIENRETTGCEVNVKLPMVAQST
jgi:nitrogen fixation/metabolism regulation signal transduction histidine kinase